jgi:hypothetical protein
MSAGNFDQQSAGRISRVVREVENGWPTNTKRTRRVAPIGGDGSIQIVRLIENVPPCRLFSSTDDFYDRLRTALADRLANTMNEGELLTIGSEIINQYTDDINSTSGTIVDRFFGSGLAYLCDFDKGRNREALTSGAIKNVNVRFTEVVRVWNMTSRSYNINDVGGAFGNEAGSLGAGYCNVIRGWDGELWLVSPDRRIIAQTESAATTALEASTATADLLRRLIEWIFGPPGTPEPPH